MLRITVSALTMMIVFVLTALNGRTAEQHDHPVPVLPKEFEQLKRMVGQWEGTTQNENKPQPVQAVYELTSGGTAILERLFAGTLHEMVSVYYADGDQLAMTHYCMLGNRPKLSLRKSGKNQLVFEMNGTDGISSKDEMHMHQVTMTFDKDGQLKQEWVGYDQGKATHTTVVNLKKK